MVFQCDTKIIALRERQSVAKRLVDSVSRAYTITSKVQQHDSERTRQMGRDTEKDTTDIDIMVEINRPSSCVCVCVTWVVMMGYDATCDGVCMPAYIQMMMSRLARAVLQTTSSDLQTGTRTD